MELKKIFVLSFVLFAFSVSTVETYSFSSWFGGNKTEKQKKKKSKKTSKKVTKGKEVNENDEERKTKSSNNSKSKIKKVTKKMNLKKTYLNSKKLAAISIKNCTKLAKNTTIEGKDKELLNEFKNESTQFKEDITTKIKLKTAELKTDDDINQKCDYIYNLLTRYMQYCCSTLPKNEKCFQIRKGKAKNGDEAKFDCDNLENSGNYKKSSGTFENKACIKMAQKTIGNAQKLRRYIDKIRGNKNNKANLSQNDNNSNDEE